MAKQGFTLNKATIGRILRTVDGGKRQAAEAILSHIDDPDARIDVYQTDREVVGVVVPADRQAKNGIATKAASAAGITQGRP
jgi:hypothetical protein